VLKIRTPLVCLIITVELRNAVFKMEYAGWNNQGTHRSGEIRGNLTKSYLQRKVWEFHNFVKIRENSRNLIPWQMLFFFYLGYFQ
jgi:hypothetical protein